MGAISQLKFPVVPVTGQETVIIDIALGQRITLMRTPVIHRIKGVTRIKQGDLLGRGFEHHRAVADVFTRNSFGPRRHHVTSLNS